MEIELTTTKKKLSRSYLNQMTEASAKDLQYAVDNSTIFGYVNSATGKERIFIIKIEEDYRKVTNYGWSRLRESLYYRGLCKKFSSEEFAENYLALFKKVKEQAMKTHIYV